MGLVQSAASSLPSAFATTVEPAPAGRTYITRRAYTPEQAGFPWR
jgi:hypothetical protein